MYEVRFHGRGGQGTVTAAELLSAAAFSEGKHAQAFPSFGSERTGAPVVSFCRIDGRPIRSREPVIRPDTLVIQDPTLLHQVSVFEGVRGDQMTGRPGIFAGGDMVKGERTVTTGVGHGKRAARCIDSWLRGERWQPAEPAALAEYDKLNTWYYSDAPATVRPELDVARRISTFDEVVGGLDESNALFEARRCLSCGNCFECDNCFGVCPDNAVIKLVTADQESGRRYEIDLDYCKGCGMCAAECPCGAIEMVPEQL